MASTSIQWTDHSINPIRATHKATGKVGDWSEWPEDLRVREYPSKEAHHANA